MGVVVAKLSSSSRYTKYASNLPKDREITAVGHLSNLILNGEDPVSDKKFLQK